MALKEPEELLRLFNKHYMTIVKKDQITAQDCNQMRNDFSEIQAYLTRCVGKPSSINAFYSQSARDGKIERQLTLERTALKEHQQFIEDNFGKAEQYLRAIQLGFYAVFFALWSLTGDFLNPTMKALAALLMIISATAFVIWELSKSTFLTYSLRHHAEMGGNKIEEFIKKRKEMLTKEQSATQALAKSRPTVWLTTILPACVAVIVMLVQLLVVISKEFFWL